MTDKSIDQLRTAAEVARDNRKLRSQRRRRAGKPPERDLKVFKLVEIEHLTHDEAARRCGLTRSRVTQIVNSVRHSLAEATPDDPEIKNFVARQRLDQALEKFRLEYVVETAVTALRKEPRSLTTRRSGDRDRDGKKELWDETTVRDQPVNVQLLKTFLRAVEGLRRLRENCLSSEPPSQQLTHEEMFEAICAVLENWHGQVQLEPDPPSLEFLRMVDSFRVNIFSWVLSRKKGTPPALAWPKPDAGNSTPRHAPGNSPSANIANLPACDVNPPLGDACNPQADTTDCAATTFVADSVSAGLAPSTG
jgi:hypothetical protein